MAFMACAALSLDAHLPLLVHGSTGFFRLVLAELGGIHPDDQREGLFHVVVSPGARSRRVRFAEQNGTEGWSGGGAMRR